MVEIQTERVLVVDRHIEARDRAIARERPVVVLAGTRVELDHAGFGSGGDGRRNLAIHESVHKQYIS